jgi:hypothetical protein
MKSTRMTRRDFIRLIGYGGVLLASQPLLNACNTYVDREPTMVVRGDPDIEIRLVRNQICNKYFPAPQHISGATRVK